MKIAIYTLMLTTILTGCGESSAPPPQKTKLFEPQREALDKAKEVQQTVDEQAERQKQETKQQTQ